MYLVHKHTWGIWKENVVVYQMTLGSRMGGGGRGGFRYMYMKEYGERGEKFAIVWNDLKGLTGVKTSWFSDLFIF